MNDLLFGGLAALHFVQIMKSVFVLLYLLAILLPTLNLRSSYVFVNKICEHTLSEQLCQ